MRVASCYSVMIREVRLRNFMTFKEETVVPFTDGLNVITGPNGAGKSSIVSAIQLCLGSLGRERLKRLSDFIRWGEREAEISVVLDNSDGRFNVNSDHVTITRILQRGRATENYLNGRWIRFRDLRELLDRAKIDADNPLAIVTQGKATRWIELKPRERLKYLESILGIQEFHESVIRLREKMEAVREKLSELNNSLLELENKLNEKIEEEERYERKMKLQLELLELAKLRKFAVVNHIRQSLVGEMEKLKEAEAEVENLKSKISERKALIEGLESKIAKLEVSEANLIGTQKELEDKIHNIEVELDRIIGEIGANMKAVNKETVKLLKTAIDTVKKLKNLYFRHHSVFESLKSTQFEIERHKLLLKRAQASLKRLNNKLSTLIEDVKVLRERIIDLQNSLKSAEDEVKGLEPPKEVPDLDYIDRRIIEVEAELKAYEKVGEYAKEEVKRLTEIYNTLESKKKEMMEELEGCMVEYDEAFKKWKAEIVKITTKINTAFSDILRVVDGEGYVKIVNIDDVQNAGIEIYAGLKGASPLPVSSLSHSGGERTIITIAFIVALHKLTEMPFRILDEFEVHLDPINLELVSKLLKEASKEAQYIIITPLRWRIPPDADTVILVERGQSERATVKLYKKS